MVRTEYLMVVIGMGLVTYIPRWLPLLFLSQKKLPTWVIRWLDFIPASILSALLVPALVTSGTPLKIDFYRPEALVAVPTFLFALKTKSLGGTVVVGMALYWLAQHYLF